MQSSSDNVGASVIWSWNGKNYSAPLGANDILILARAVEEEGFPEQGVAWCLVQRWLWLRMSGINIGLSKLVQDYAQPINPEWFPNGKKHHEEIARLNRIGDYSGAQLENIKAGKRLGKASKPWGQIGENVKNVLSAVLTNKLTTPVIGAVHYWASRGPDFATNQRKKPGLILLDRGYGFGPGRNVFFAVKGSEKFGPSIRFINGEKAWPGNDGLPPVNIASMGGNIIVGLVAAYFAWKWFS